MSDCLVTKLKTTVDNDNLPILGALRIRVHIPSDIDTSQTNYYFRADPAANSGLSVTIEATGDGYFMKAKGNTTSIGTSITVTVPQEIIPSPGDYDIIIHDYYNISTFDIVFVYISNTTAYFLPNQNIKILNYMPYISNVRLLSNVYGNLSDLYNICTVLSFINSSNVYGNLQTYAYNIWKKNINTYGNTYRIYINSNMSIGNFVPGINGYGVDISFSTDGCTIIKASDQTTIYTYDGATDTWTAGS